jgi:uncharacterized protein YbcI
MDSGPAPREGLIAAISGEIAQVHTRIFGQAPGNARTLIAEDFVVCVLERVFTAPERTLVAAGRFDRVRNDRQAVRGALEPTFVALIETITRRPVRAYMTEISPDDAAFEAFVLAPSP